MENHLRGKRTRLPPNDESGGSHVEKESMGPAGDLKNRPPVNSAYQRQSMTILVEEFPERMVFIPYQGIDGGSFERFVPG